MIDVVAVLRVEDVAVEFLSVLDPGRGREVHLLIADRGAYLRLPADVPLAGRLAHLAELMQASGEGAKPFSPGQAADTIALETGDVAATIWTHNPADSRERRARWAFELAGLVRAPVLHSVGDARWLEWIADVDERLERPLVEAKLDFVTTHCAALVGLDAEDENALITRRVPSVERFFSSDPHERGRLVALLRSSGDDAAVVPDPLELATSEYEIERLDATAAWVRRHLDPAAGPVIEVGACEGALTRRLAGERYIVEATEPNPVFLARLQEGFTGHGDVRIHPHSFEDLATTRRLTGSAYLLIELLYYGQDLALLDRFPTDRLFVSMEPGALAEQSWPAGWTVEEEVDLVLPRFESVVNGRAHLRKRGSRGLLLLRRR